MKIPLLSLKASNKISKDCWQEIIDLASGELSSTEGLVAALKQRQRIALYRYKGEIVGIAALDILPEEFEGKKACAIYTGNTWVRNDFRNANLIQSLAFISMLEAKARYPLHRLYWFFGSNNYMSYRLMYRNFDQFWPSPNEQTPNWEHSYMQHLGITFFDETLNKDTLVWSQPYSRSFKDSDTQLSEKLMQDTYIQYYLERNPGYTQGDRLMCMAPLDRNTIPNIVKQSAKRLWRLMQE